MIIGTAGHIDHGKSSLVEALTGTRMDRLREERERGITIELNFAPFDLGDGRVAGVVDVPGHEDFVRTMVAGASGIDLVLLAVAADEGIKPQTREHLAVAEQLGIRRGIPVITKVDLVDPEYAGLLALELADWLKASPIRFDPPQQVSVVSGIGVAELAAELRRQAAGIPPRHADDLFRLPVDRSFSVAGIGTVVTGTTWSGTLAPGDQVQVLPRRKNARVRTVQVHGRDVARSEPGMRVALGLAGIAREDITRGDTIVAAGEAWEPSLAFDVFLALLPEAPRVLIPRSRVRLHLGTSEVIARVFPVASRIEPGGSGMARLALESPAVARGGDRFVVRGFSPVITIGGGRVLDPLPPRKKAAWPPALSDEDPTVRAAAVIDRRPSGAEARQLPVLLGVNPGTANNILAASPRFLRAGDYWVPRDKVDEVARDALEQVEEFHRRLPEERGMPLAELRQSLRTAPWVLTAALDQLEREAILSFPDGLARKPGFKPRVAGGSEQVRRVVAEVRKAGLTPPTAAELGQALGLGDVAATLRLAAGEGFLEPVERDRYYAREALERLVAAMVELGNAGPFTPAQVRDRLGITRKYLIPLLEWSDARGITLRVGEGRRLRPGFQLPWRVQAT